MPAKRRMYKNDLKPDYTVSLTNVEEDDTETPVDLSTADSVRVIGVHIDSETGTVTPKFDRAADTWTAGGQVMMSWQVGDTDTVGFLYTEIEVMWPGSKPQTFRPSEVIDIRADYGGVV